MKKLGSILLSLALVFTFASIGLFAMAPDGMTTVQYTITPTYTVVIPETATAGNSLVISATSMNIEPTKQVVVKISSGLTSNNVTLVRQGLNGQEQALEDGSNVLLAPVTLGGEPVYNNTHVASFRGVSTDNYIQDTLYIGSPNTDGKLAGTYVGTLTFDIGYVDLYA